MTLAEESSCLVQALRCYVGCEETEARTPGDAAKLVRLLGEHRVLATLGPQLATAPEIAARLVDVRRRGLLLELTLRRVAECFEAHGIPWIALKGIALGRTVYRRREDRFLGDLDILVRREHLETAKRALESVGLRPAETGRWPEFYERYHFHWIYTNEVGVWVELHWDLSRPADYVRFDLDGIEKRAIDLTSDGLALRVPEPGDLLLHTAAQALWEGFVSLRRIVDAALLVRQGALDSPELVARAKAAGLGTALWLLLSVERELTGRLGTGLSEALGPNRLTRACLRSLRCAGRSIGDVRTGEPEMRRVRSLLSMLCSPDARALTHCVGRHVWPGPGEWMEAGRGPSSFPSPRRRLAEATLNTATLVDLLRYQAVRLVLR